MNRYGKNFSRKAHRSRLIRLGMAIVLLGCMATTASAEGDREERIALGYTDRVFKHRNQNDILAAITVWVDAIRADSGLPIDPQMTVFRHREDFILALAKDEISMITLGLPEYHFVPPGHVIGPYLSEMRGGSTHVQYVLIAAKGSGVADAGDLKGKRVCVLDHSYVDVGMLWLTSLLQVAGRGSLQDTAAKVDFVPKASSAVLDVFFGRADASLVPSHVLATMRELNPQVGERLTIVATSEPIVNGFLAFNPRIPIGIRSRLVEVITSIHDSPAGEQLSMMFQLERMGVITEEELQRSVQLLGKWSEVSGLGLEEASR